MMIVSVSYGWTTGQPRPSTELGFDNGSNLLIDCMGYVSGCTCHACSDADVWVATRGCAMWPARLAAMVQASASKLPPINPPQVAPSPAPIRINSSPPGTVVLLNPRTGSASVAGVGGGGGGGGAAAPASPPIRMNISPNGISFDGFSWPAGVEVFHPEAKPGQLPPQNCKACNFRNEYAGPEHLIDGVYYCRQCTPKALRQKALRK